MAEEVTPENKTDESDESPEGDKVSEDKGKQEPEDFKSKYFYLAAEMDNMRKRFARERESIVKYGNEKVLLALVEVVDNLDNSYNALTNETDDKIKNIANGIEMIRKQFLAVLSQNGLEPVKTLGEMFDPNLHEALLQQPAEGKKNQEIISEYKKGYTLNGRLLRPAKVIVAKST
ncbi:MAG: nucleotide exchange factor GrpE [Pseudomonadota bacterium]